MNSNLKRLAALAAVGAMGILAPDASASAASAPTSASLAVSLDVPGVAPDFLSFVGPSVLGGAPAVIGPTVYTVGVGNTFIETTITTTAGGAVVATSPVG
jgi:hypothetical protein